MENKTQVIRLNVSSYQGPLFFKQEKEFLSSLNNLEYVREWDGQSPTILITNTHTEVENISSELLEKTKLIIHPNSGYDNFSPTFTESNNFPIILGNPIRANAVSEYILSSLLSYFSQIPNHKTWDKTRTWNRKRLKDLKVQIIGYGMIGQILEKSLSPLVKDIFIYDPFKSKIDLQEKVADVILMASSLNPTSSKILDENFFKGLRKDVLIINAARGGLIDQKSLLKFLTQNPEAFAFLDVFEQEPFDSTEFDTIKNLVKTSHIAGVYKELNNELLNFEKQILTDFLNKDSSNMNFEEKYQGLILKNRLHQDFLI